MQVFVPHFQKEPISLKGLSGLDLAQQMGVKEAIAMKINDRLVDLKTVLQKEDRIEFIEATQPEGLEILRHSAAHVLAQAIKELYPDTQIAIGPVIENGFYYDLLPIKPFVPEDLVRLEERMKEIVHRDELIIRHTWSRKKALDFFTKQKEDLKVKIIQEIPEDQEISVYQQGEHFVDLCRGPHLPSTRYLKAFHLTKVSGSYWKGDSRNTPLQRIYGTAWPSMQAMQDYLKGLEEAEKKDHRLLGQQMDLFHFQEEAPGSVFWHANGWTIYQALQAFMRRLTKRHGYQEVNTPQLVDKSLWERSGHWEKFRNNMYLVEQESHTYGLKAMSCPCHVQIFNHQARSYRELPLRMSEFGCCMRHEAAGARSGLMRVASFVQDDGHIFCTPEQLIKETKDFCDLLFQVYRDLGFEEVIVRLSTRPEMRLGSDALWDHAEDSLRQGAEAAQLTYTLFPGEGAFYGPKLEFVLKDALGRLWQCGTLQVDFVLPERLSAFYIAQDGSKQHPIMIHRAILGTFERFMGVLLEHTGGALPLWLCPVQAVIAGISEKAHDYVLFLQQSIQAKDPGCLLRIHADLRNEKIGYKIREHTLRKVPYMLIVGEKEAKDYTVTLRHQNQQQTMPWQEAYSLLWQKALPPDGAFTTLSTL